MRCDHPGMLPVLLLLLLITAPSRALYSQAQDAGSVTAHLKSISCFGEARCVAAGEVAVILGTTDKGRTWTVLNVPTGISNDLESVSMSKVEADAGMHAIAVGSGGMIVKTADFGATTWNRVTSGVTSNLMGVHMSTKDIIYVVGDSAVIRRSADGGASWTAQTAPGGFGQLNAVSCFSGGSTCA